MDNQAETQVETPTTVTEPDYNSFDYDENDPANAHDAVPADVQEPDADEPEVVADTPDVVEDTPTDQPDEQKPSPRYEKRIRQLSAKVRELRTEGESKPAAPAPQTPATVQPTATPRDLPEGDYTPEEINKWVKDEASRAAQALANDQVAQLRAEIARDRAVNEVKTTYADDLRYVESKYGELNEDSADFDPHLAQVVTEVFEDALLANPTTASLKKVADSIVGISRRNVAVAEARTTKTVAKAAASAAPAPSAGTKQTGEKWTPEKVAALDIDQYEKHEKEIKRDLYGL